jgi:hypothetical protein
VQQQSERDCPHKEPTIAAQLFPLFFHRSPTSPTPTRTLPVGVPFHLQYSAPFRHFRHRSRVRYGRDFPFVFSPVLFAPLSDKARHAIADQPKGKSRPSRAHGWRPVSRVPSRAVPASASRPRLPCAHASLAVPPAPPPGTAWPVEALVRCRGFSSPTSPRPRQHTASGRICALRSGLSLWLRLWTAFGLANTSQITDRPKPVRYASASDSPRLTHSRR